MWCTVHVGVGTAGQHDKLGEMGRAGLLGSDTTYIHCTTLNDDEIQMIVDTGGTVSLASPVEMLMGHGMPPIQRFLDRGLRPSLSVDVETNVPGDMFTQMRSVMSLQRCLVYEQVLQGKDDCPDCIATQDVLEFATIEGARANGLEDKVGTLTPGKEGVRPFPAPSRVTLARVPRDPRGYQFVQSLWRSQGGRTRLEQISVIFKGAKSPCHNQRLGLSAWGAWALRWPLTLFAPAIP